MCLLSQQPSTCPVTEPESTLLRPSQHITQVFQRVSHEDLRSTLDQGQALIITRRLLCFLPGTGSPGAISTAHKAAGRDLASRLGCHVSAELEVWFLMLPKLPGLLWGDGEGTRGDPVVPFVPNVTLVLSPRFISFCLSPPSPLTLTAA